MLRCDLKRALFSWRFAISAICIPLTRLAGSTEMFTGDAVSTIIYSNDLFEIAVALAAAPFIADFAQSIICKSYMPYVLRCGKNSFIISTLLTLICTVFLANALGQALYICILGLNEPLALTAESAGGEYNLFSAYFLAGALKSGNPYPFFLGQIIASGVVCVEFAMASLFISVFCSSAMFVYATPFLLYLFAGYAAWTLGIPYYLTPSSQYEGWLTNSPLRDVLILFGQAAGIISLFGALFVYFARRRVANA